MLCQIAGQFPPVEGVTIRSGLEALGDRRLLQTVTEKSQPPGLETDRITPSPGQLLWMYEHMTLIREFEERLKWLVETGVPVGAVHYYTGQEACAVGVCAALEPTDWIASTHRGHGHCIAKGVEVHRMMAELYGKVTGTNRGKGGSMHITDVRVGMLGVNPIVGMGATHAVGAALSAKVRHTSQVAVAFFGEGAASFGALHEAMNLAAIWKLPVVFVCENNRYSQSIPVEYAVAATNIADRAAAYRMPGVTVDGQDDEVEGDAERRSSCAAAVRFYAEDAAGDGLRNADGVLRIVNDYCVYQVQYTHDESADEDGRQWPRS